MTPATSKQPNGENACSAPHHPSGPVGYVLKVFPRVSETFVINEILALESFGRDVCVFSLHHPPAAVTHAILAAVRAPVAYVEDFRPDESDVARARRRLAAHFELSPEDADRFLPRKYVRLALALTRLAAERGVTRLHAHFASRSAHVAALAAALMPCPYSITAHAKDIYHDEVEPDVLRWKMRHASFVVTVTDYNRRHLEELAAGDPAVTGKLLRLYNGVDLSRFQAASLPEGKPLLLGVGRLVEKKGFEHLITASAMLAERGYDFACEIVGGGERGDALRDCIAQLGVEHIVKLAGSLPTEQVTIRLRDAYALVLPCIVGNDGNVDALPTAIIEAMASARPVVSTRLSGIPEMVVEGETGLLVEPGDARALADALASLLDDRARAAAMGRAGRARAEELFDLYANARVLDGLLAQSPQSRKAV